METWQRRTHEEYNIELWGKKRINTILWKNYETVLHSAEYWNIFLHQTAKMWSWSFFIPFLPALMTWSESKRQ